MPDPAVTIPVTYDADSTLVVRIPGRPLSWKRPENTARGGRRTNPEQRARQREIRTEVDAALRARGEFARPVFEPGEFVAIDVVSCYPRPQRPTTALPSHADVDNLAKIVLDALEGLVYANDRQVVALLTVKGYADPPGFVEVVLRNAHPHDVEADPVETVEIRTQETPDA